MVPAEDLISWHSLYLFSESCSHYQKCDFAGVNLSTGILLLAGQATHTRKLPAISSPGRSHSVNQNRVKLSPRDIVAVSISRRQLCRRARDSRQCSVSGVSLPINTACTGTSLT